MIELFSYRLKNQGCKHSQKVGGAKNGGWPAIAKVCHCKDPRVRVRDRVRVRIFAMAALCDGGLEPENQGAETPKA